jgi:3-oxoacyl-[acyl-carrier protein] reductase
MDLGLEDKVVLVSGGSSGIGKAIALDFARQNAAVLVVARRLEPLQDTVKELQHINARSAYISADMTQEDGVNAAIAESIRAFGSVPDVVVCNVRSLIKLGFEEASADDFRLSSEQCVLSVVHLAKAVLPHWKAQRWGRFINLGSVCTLEPHRWHHIVLGNTFRLYVISQDHKHLPTSRCSDIKALGLLLDSCGPFRTNFLRSVSLSIRWQ